MKISHESPLCLLEFSKFYNDYDYALVHLFEVYPQYLQYFENSIKSRNMYLDNSIFELGEAFSQDKFITYCDYFASISENNFHYIVPDVLEDCNATISNFEKFDYNRGKRIGVAQGSTKSETIECFKFMKDKCDIVGISFDYSWYNPNTTSKEQFYKEGMIGRVNFIHELQELGLLEGTKIHLLGTYLPQEVSFYSKIPEIYSVDTSNPITHGIFGIQYSERGLELKESKKLAELMECEIIKPEIFKNILMFRYFANFHN